MRVWVKSACVVVAWSALLITMVAGVSRSHPAQASIRIAGSATSTAGITLADTPSVAAVSVTAASLAAQPGVTLSVTAASPAARYTVQPGDTLSGIAARYAVRGGWRALYAANRPLIGPNPNLIRPGTVLVLPTGRAPTRYVVAAGDTLAAIAAALAVHGGWPALYAANRRVIGANPDLIRPGTVLAIPRPAVRPPSGWRPGHRLYPPWPPSAPTGIRHRPGPARARMTGMPGWLTTLLLAVGLLIVAVFLAEPVLAVRRRRAAAWGARATGSGAALADGSGAAPAGSGQAAGGERSAGGKARIVMAEYDRLVVTRSTWDGMVYVLRPPGAEPAAVLRVARLVLPEASYVQLADQLGMPASWPVE
jgi:LysM repeat protein